MKPMLGTGILEDIEFEKELELSETEAKQGRVRPFGDALKDIRRRVLWIPAE